MKELEYHKTGKKNGAVPSLVLCPGLPHNQTGAKTLSGDDAHIPYLQFPGQGHRSQPGRC